MDTEIRTNNYYSQFIKLCDKAIEVLLIILLAIMPFAFGSVRSWSKEIVVIFSAAVLFIFLLRQILTGEGFVSTPAYLPIAALILLGIFTLIPLPQKAVSILSPQTVRLKNELLSENQEPQQNENYTLSFYPCGTKDNLRVILSAAAVFVVVLNVFKSTEQIRKLLQSIAIIGAAVAALALAQNLIGNEKIFWIITAPGKAQSGPFVNHSHFGQFMNLSIGAAISISLLALYREFDQRNASAAAVFEYFDSTRARELWLAAAMISVSAAAVFASLTRGGMLSMLIAMSITVLLLSARKSLRQHGWIVVIIALAALVCLLYTGFDTVYERLATLSALDKYPTRLAVLKDMSEPVRRFITFGTGLGSHNYIYPMFQSIFTALRFSYAENEYAQLLEETGIAGFAIMLIFAFIILTNFIKAVRNKNSSKCIMVYGLGFGLTAILIHSVTDFGQHLPANAMLSTIFCALIIILSKSAKYPQNIATFRLPKAILIPLTAVLICVYGWALLGADKARIGEYWWLKSLKTEKKMRDGTEINATAEYEKLISYASNAAKAAPDNIEYQYWLNVWKWRNNSNKIDAQTGTLTNEAMEQVYNIAADLKKSRFLCPTYGPVYCLLGQLQEFVLLEPAGEDNIKKGFRLEPNDELTQFAAGCVDVRNGKLDDSFEKFGKSIALGGNYFDEIIHIYIQQEKKPDLAIKIAADDTERLKSVADALLESKDFVGEAQTAKLKLIEIAELKAAGKTACLKELNLLGEFYYKKNNQKAVQYFGAAVQKDYGNAVLRLEYAQALAANGQSSDAIKQLRICLKLRPKYEQAEILLAELSVRPEVMKQNLGETEIK